MLDETRGYRNNNPGNIRLFKKPDGSYIAPFIGEVRPPDEKEFRKFVSMPYGYRALFMVLESKIKKGFNTIPMLIYSYAPPIENPTPVYINSVVANTGIPPERILKADEKTLINLAGAISEFENGKKANKKELEESFKLFRTSGVVEKPANNTPEIPSREKENFFRRYRKPLTYGAYALTAYGLIYLASKKNYDYSRY